MNNSKKLYKIIYNNVKTNQIANFSNNKIRVQKFWKIVKDNQYIKKNLDYYFSN